MALQTQTATPYWYVQRVGHDSPSNMIEKVLSFKLDAPRLLRELREAPDKAKAAATLLSETHMWLTQDVIVTYMREAITQYSSSVRFID